MVTLTRKIVLPTLLFGAALAALVAWAAWEGLRELRALEGRAAAVRNANALVYALGDATRQENALLLSITAAPEPAHEVRVRRAGARVRQVMGGIADLDLQPRAAAAWAQYLEARTALEVIRDAVLARAREGEPERVRIETGRWLMMKRRSDALLADLTGYHLRSLHRTVTETQLRRAEALRTTVAGSVLAVLMLVGLAFLVGRNVVRPIVEIARAAERIAETGRAAEVGGGHRRDEIGTLARSFNRMTERLLGANAQLEEADRRKDEFLGMLSHELRNPLAPALNALHVLDRARPGSPESGRAREVLRRQLRHIARIVDDLLDVTRIARGKIELRRGEVDLGELVRRCGEDHAAMLRDRSLELEVDAPPSGALRVHADETRLAQVIGNLVQNAAKFTPPGGRVTLSAARQGDEAELRVSDTGVGIDAELLARVFEPFTQANQALARTAGGLGLGLAFVKGIAELHGGSALAASEGEGKGSTFVVRLPALAPLRTTAPPVPAPAAGPRGAGARQVLVVDDNVDAADLLGELLRTLGHEVDVAHDGPSALERVRARPPEVVLCDIGLPGMSGYDVARAIRAAGHDRMLLVALSGYAQPSDVERAHESGFDRHLAKPCDLDVLERLLGENGARAGAAVT